MALDAAIYEHPFELVSHPGSIIELAHTLKENGVWSIGAYPKSNIRYQSAGFMRETRWVVQSVVLWSSRQGRGRGKSTMHKGVEEQGIRVPAECNALPSSQKLMPLVC